MLEYVLEGVYGVRAEDLIEVVRTNGEAEAVAAGTEITLTAGDALISRNETVVEVWNGGNVPVKLLNWMMIDGATGHLVPGSVRGSEGIRFALTPPAGSATVTLLRVTLPVGGGVDLAYPGRRALRCSLHRHGRLHRST